MRRSCFLPSAVWKKSPKVRSPVSCAFSTFGFVAFHSSIGSELEAWSDWSFFQPRLLVARGSWRWRCPRERVFPKWNPIEEIKTIKQKVSCRVVCSSYVVAVPMKYKNKQRKGKDRLLYWIADIILHQILTLLVFSFFPRHEFQTCDRINMNWSHFSGICIENFRCLLVFALFCRYSRCCLYLHCSADTRAATEKNHRKA